MGEVFRMRRVGHVDDRGAVVFGLPSQRVDRLLGFRNAAVMADIGDPAVALVVDDRLIGTARLQIAVADQRHVAGLGILLRQGGVRRAEEQRSRHHDAPNHTTSHVGLS
jgi:hypothetical protein